MNVAMHTNFRIRQREQDNFRPITCAQAECEAFRNGWVTIVSANMADQVRTIARDTGRHFVEAPGGPGLVAFTFPPGQEGFKGGDHDHVERIDVVQTFSKQDGHAEIGVNSRRQAEWFWQPSGDRRKLSAQTWVDDFGEHQERLAAEAQKG
jgi:hypothetical protein